MKPHTHRRSIRLQNYDYSQPGAYFVTICTYRRKCLFGYVEKGTMHLTNFGEIARQEWLRSEEIRSEIRLDLFVVMPNHLHCIVVITHSDGIVGAHGRAPLRRSPRSLGSFIAGFKSVVTRRISQTRGTSGSPVWQRNYYEHVIRSEDELQQIREYILNNPARWFEDPDNPIHAS
ncbi:MAG: hypothetical protein KAT23_07475 [Anaerolineales bacterium]|nr:hypothetical protein [Anaerolineales bacterium]